MTHGAYLQSSCSGRTFGRRPEWSAALRGRGGVWPFWLLIAAWAFANVPAGTVAIVADWLHEARHFSHQQRLKNEVAQLLEGTLEAAVLNFQAAAETPHDSQTAVPSIAWKKIELGLDDTQGVLPPVGIDFIYAAGQARALAELRAPPLQGPPRVA